MTGVYIPTATEADWLAARRDGITASEIAVVLGLSPFESPFALYHRKRGDLAEMEDSEALRIGRHLESLVCEMFSDRHPEYGLAGDGRQLYRHPDRPWQLATPDSLVFESASYACCCDASQDPEIACACITDGPVATFEAKTSYTYDEWGEDGTDEIPVHYRCQKLWQMDVMGVTAGYLGCLFVQARKYREYELTLDDDARADLKLMREEAALFYERHLLAGREPDVDWRPATAGALKHLHPDLEDRDVTVTRTLAGQYRAACAAVRKAEQRKALAENRLRARLGNGRRALDPDGQPVATRQVYDVKAHVRKAATVNKIVPAKTAKGDQS